MRRLSRRVVLSLALLALAVPFVAAGVAGSAREATPASSLTASAAGVRVLVPGADAAGTQATSAPPASTPVTTSLFAYPASGSAVMAVTTSASASAEGEASATSGATGIVLFGGELTADAVNAHASAFATASKASGDFAGTAVQNLQALGSPVTGGFAELSTWGTLSRNVQSVDASAAGGTGYAGSVVALEVRLTSEHGGLPPGTVIQLGYAEASAVPAPEAAEPTPQATEQPTTTTHKPTPRPQPKPEATPEPVAPKPQKQPEPAPEPVEQVPPPAPEPPPGLFPIPPELTPKLEGGPYVFPVFAGVDWGNTYGAIRSDVSYHHGDDLFGELGQPLVAVADGTVFSVGWNKIGGNRLWLRDRQGNAFYYAHLSAFSTLVYNGARVKAGQVLGFMGTTGDAEGTPTHLHFEVHPVSLLYLGYDGAIDPTPFLDQARRLQRLPFAVPPGWSPSITGGNAAPQPGAILLAVSDISRADGLDPASLRRALESAPARP